MPTVTELGPVAWPPDPIRTERLVLRESEARDRAAFIELLASPEVHTYLGGPRPRDELEREMPGAPERWPGSFVVDLDGAMIGQILLRRATGHRRPAAAGKADLGYLFLPRGVGIRVRRRGVRGGTRLVRRRPSRRAGGAHHPVRQRRLDAPRGKAGVHRGRAVPGLGRRAVARPAVPGHAVRLRPHIG